MAGLILDLSMVALAVLNLSWIVFDSAWAVPELRYLMSYVVPMAWLDAYAVVHEHFFRIDLIFVAIFLTEFSLRWLESLWSRRHSAWYVFPLLHWYDLLGCIPVAGLRWLRILRIFAILLRLQRLGLIDYTGWRPYRWVMKAYDIVMEEISDRVVIRVLSGVQDEMAASHDVERRILEQVVNPRRELITRALRERLVHISQSTYASAREDLHAFITDAVSTAVQDNREIKRIDRIPVVGGMVGKLLDEAITDIVCGVIDELSGRLDSREFETLFNDISTAIFDALNEAARDGGSDEVTRAVNDVLELVKQQVGQRRWLGAR